jgi:hypothetical protein
MKEFFDKLLPIFWILFVVFINTTEVAYVVNKGWEDKLLKDGTYEYKVMDNKLMLMPKDDEE